MFPVSFGSMLLECMLAVIALIAVASFASGEAAVQGWDTPAQIFAGAVANFLTNLGLPLDIVFTLVGYKNIWALFGASNQLLSVFAFLACAVFLKRCKKVRWFMYIPLGFMLAVTFTALGMTVYDKARAFITSSSADVFGDTLQLVFASLIIIFGICVVAEGFKKLFAKKDNQEALN